MATTYPEWTRLEELLTIVQAEGFTRLEADEIIEFGKLYRRAAAELAFSRTHEADPARQVYLNDLLGRCYPYVYAAPRRPWPSFLRFYTVDFPHTLRRHSLWVLLAVLLSIIPGIISFSVTLRDRAIAYQVLPPALMGYLDTALERHLKPHEWTSAEKRPEMASFIMTNNIGVAISEFAGGMTAGILTIFLLVYNGIMLGIMVAAACHSTTVALNLFAFVVPHGVLELPAIFIAGGAGLLLAYALINPGELPRGVALRQAGKEAVKLMIGVASMLVIAGLIESFYSPRNFPEIQKYAVASGEGVLLLLYIIFSGRHTRVEDDASPYGKLLSSLPPI